MTFFNFVFVVGFALLDAEHLRRTRLASDRTQGAPAKIALPVPFWVTSCMARLIKFTFSFFSGITSTGFFATISSSPVLELMIFLTK